MLAFWILPDTPMNAWFLTEEEKYHAVTRLASNKTGIASRVWKWDQALEAVADIKTWLIFLFNISINVPNGGKWVRIYLERWSVKD
jgi:MFS transporter, ACS family, allantoate permease